MAILITNDQSRIQLDLKRVRKSLRAILELVNCSDRELSVLFVDDDKIQELNKQYLDRDRTTNVISFAMSEGEFSGVSPFLLGDVIISVETAQKDSDREGLSFEDELDYLMIHGILHLLGYDHESPDSNADDMKEKERELFFALKGYEIE